MPNLSQYHIACDHADIGTTGVLRFIPVVSQYKIFSTAQSDSGFRNTGIFHFIIDCTACILRLTVHIQDPVLDLNRIPSHGDHSLYIAMQFLISIRVKDNDVSDFGRGKFIDQTVDIDGLPP